MKPRPIHAFVDGKGYICLANDNCVRRIHRLIAQSIYGTIPDGHDVHHIDGDKQNNSPENLEVIDRKTHAHRHVVMRKMAKEIGVLPIST